METLTKDKTMKTFYIRLVAKTYAECLIEAETEEEAHQIAHNLDINDTLEETECYDIWDMEECDAHALENLSELPILQQTKDGYKVKA